MPNRPSYVFHGLENAPEVTEPIQLDVIGVFPHWVSGSLYRTGPATFRFPVTSDNPRPAPSVQHWFDGLGMTHRFDIHGEKGQVTYSSRSSASGQEKMLREEGAWTIPTFGQQADPCESYFAKFLTVFRFATMLPRDGGRDGWNLSVTLRPNMPGFSAHATELEEEATPGRPAYLAATSDFNMLQFLDPDSLAPTAIEHEGYGALDHRLSGGMTASHACVDPVTGDTYNFVLNFGKTPTYTVFGIPGDSGHGSTEKVNILAVIDDAPSAYIHSFFMTTKYVVLCVWQADLTANGLAFLWHRNVIQSLRTWDPNRDTLFYVISREGGLVAKYTAPSFFAFHCINSYEEDDDLVLDVCTYPDTSVLNSYYLDRLRATSSLAHERTLSGQARRYRLKEVSLRPGTEGRAAGQTDLVVALPEGDNIELPTVNPQYAWRKYRYTYGVSRDNPATVISDQIIKLNMDAAARFSISGHREPYTLVWFEEGCTPGEAIFVPKPDGQREDDGVLLSVVLDNEGRKSMLVCLDARDMRELGRATMGRPFPLGFHGVYVD